MREIVTALTRHTVLVMAALAICAVTAALLRDRPGTPGTAGSVLALWPLARESLLG